MRSVIKALVLVAACALAPRAESSVSFSLGVATGDGEFDLVLRNINTEAEQSLPSFYASMRVNYGASPEAIDGLLYQHKLSPAEAFMVFRLSILIGKPAEYVVVRYSKHRGRGWGAVAKSLGIKPGSAEFHKLKEGGAVILEHSKKERVQVEFKVGDHSGKGNKADKGGGKGKNK